MTQKKIITTRICRLIFKQIFASLPILFALTGFLACADNRHPNENRSTNANEAKSNSVGKTEKESPVDNNGRYQADGASNDPAVAPKKEESLNNQSKNKSKNISSAPIDNNSLIYGITIGRMDLLFKVEGNQLKFKPGAEKALEQVKKDGFLHIHMMQPFVRNFMENFPSLPVQAVKLIHDRGFKVLLTLNESPFINGAKDERKWAYNYFPGMDKIGSDDDGGIDEHKLRMKKFMDALKKENLIDGMQFQLFDEPNAARVFWGTFPEFIQLLDVNIEILTRPEYGISKKDILFCAFTSTLMTNGNKVPPAQLPFWELAKSYKENPKYNQFPFCFNWYPVRGNPQKGENRTSADIKVKPMPEGGWITGMNVAAFITEGNLKGKNTTAGYRSLNTFTEKLNDIDAFAKKHHFSGIYIFNLITREDKPDERGKINTGLFNSKGCPRHEYKELLEFLKRPINFEMCPVPKKTDF